MTMMRQVATRGLGVAVYGLLGLLLLGLLLVPSTLSAQQLTGGVTGLVKDMQGGVLPGVTVSIAGQALIGGALTTVTSGTGTYQFTGLPPGMYTLTYELEGFTALRREEVRVQVAQTTRVDVEMTLGGVAESVTVTGETPLIDVVTTTTQTNIDRDFFEAVPSSNSPWTMANLVPGVVASRLDVGGTEAMQQYNLEAYGSSNSQKSFTVDGVKMNWSGGSGGSANQYYSNDQFEEYNIQTSSGTAESDVSGVYLNMVTKSGGNQFSGDYTLLFANEAMQGDNVDDRILGLLGAEPGEMVAAAGNPIDIMYDWSASLGGPVVRDKLWFFASMRWFRLDQFQIGAVNPDGSLGIDDNLAKSGTAKVTYQATRSTTLSFVLIPAIRERFHRRDSPYLSIPDVATRDNILDADSFVARANQVIGDNAVLNVSVGKVFGSWANQYQPEVGPDDIVLTDTVTRQRFNASIRNDFNPNHRYQVNTTLSYFAQDLTRGNHNFKLGFQYSTDTMDWERTATGDMQLEMRDGVPFRALLLNTPNTALHRWNTWGAFVQDQWLVGRLALNAGVRFDGAKAFLPEQTSLAGAWVGARDFPKTDVYDFNFNIGPRIGVVYDLLGDGRTAVKAYYGRFYDQFGAQIPEAVNPNNLSSVQVPWDDANGNLRYDPGELDLSTFDGFQPGLFPVMAPDARRPHSGEFSLAFEHQLPYDLGLSVSYHRRQLRDSLTIIDQARPTSAYTPQEFAYTDGGVAKTITVYNLDPSLVRVRDRIITNADVVQSNYNGVDVTVTKKLSNRWQLLGGLTLSSHKGFDHGGTYTNPGNSTDLNNPNYRMNRDDGAVFTDLPWTFKLAGSYRLPHDVSLSGKLQARKGDPLARGLVVTGLNQGSEVVYVQPRGEDRTETVKNFIDLRVAKTFEITSLRLEAAFDVYNVLNANPVLAQNDRIGSALGQPERILAPRLFRINFALRF